MSDTPERIGSFRILGVMGRGGMGIVYRGVHETTGIEAAIKTVRDAHGDFVQSLRREIHALSRMDHPGVVRVLESGLELGMPWYAMELLDGITLREKLRRRAAGMVQESTNNVLPSIPTASNPATDRPDHSGDGTEWWTLRVNKGAAESAETPQFGARSPSINSDSLDVTETASTVVNTHRPIAAEGRLGEALTLVRRLCETLAFLHGEGVVHRDLKPENILLVSARRAKGRDRTTVSSKKLDARGKGRMSGAALDAGPSFSGPDGSSDFGRPVLVDFGLASRWPLAMVGRSGAEQDQRGRESLDAAVQAAGTLAYMAPEQLRGELVDARANLYALGCILYELITGRRPFLAKTESGLVRAHLQTEPVAPSQLVDGVDPALDGLTLGLLSKDPRQRIGHADAVARALELLGADAKPLTGTPKHRAYLYRPSFAGRAEPLSSLMQWTGMGTAGQGTLICIGGESGVGKTRLALELGRRLGAWGATVLVGGSSLEAGGAERQAQPLGALRAPLQTLADRCGANPVEARRLFGGRIRILAAYAPTLLQLPCAADEPELATLPAEAARLRLFEAISETFDAATRGSQTVLLLDDLQNADELSLSWLEALLRSGRLERLPLSIVCTYRSDAVREDPLQVDGAS